MTFNSGTKLGPYEIVAAVGAGGQGDVYKARDTRLNRTVAIKILSLGFSDNAERKARFDREAQTIAGLNHPHICVLHDVGHQEGADYLVMEYLDGQTLAARLEKGAVPFDEAMKIAIDIADALDKAHRQGVIHRDLKPSNVMLTKSGAKLLDFGLAKLQQDAQPVPTISSLPTNADVTAKGTILGTLQYMAPEQLEGRDADARSDIFAFGTMLYEMITGRKAFEAKSQASLIAKILETAPPSMASLQPVTPASLEHLVRRCLAKNPDERWQTANDLCQQLKWVMESSSAHVIAPAIARPAERRPFKTILVGGLAVGACVVVGLAVWFLKPAPAKPVTRFTISLPAGQRLDTGRPALAISPDGTRLAYVAGAGNGPQIYIRALDAVEAQPLPGTEGARNPFFSPDGQWVGFSALGKLKKVSLNGGAPITLADVVVTGILGASWSSQGTIAFTPSGTGPIQQIPEGGGNPQTLTIQAKGEASQRAPQFLPDGKSLLFASYTNPTAGNVSVQAAGSTEHRVLLQSPSPAVYTSSGHFVYWQGGNLMAAPFNLKQLSITGPSVPVVEGTLPLQWSVSSTGTLIYAPGTTQAALLKLVWVDRKGTEQPVNAPPHTYVLPRISPDGHHVAAGIEEKDAQIWVYDVSRDTLTRLTFEGNGNIDPVWTPDGKRITFKGAGNGLFWQPADGSGPAESLTSSPMSSNNVPGSWSPDGTELVFTQDTATRNIWILPRKDGKPRVFVQSPSYETAPRFSPDGHWIAYDSNDSGRDEIFVRPYPGPGGKWQISTDGGTEPVWNPKGGELFYRSGNKMMAVEITTQPGFAAGKPKMLFEGAYVPTPRSFPDYDVSPDGQRFLMLKTVEQAQFSQINVVLNWFTELQQRAPVK